MPMAMKEKCLSVMSYYKGAQATEEENILGFR